MPRTSTLTEEEHTSWTNDTRTLKPWEFGPLSAGGGAQSIPGHACGSALLRGHRDPQPAVRPGLTGGWQEPFWNDGHNDDIYPALTSLWADLRAWAVAHDVWAPFSTKHSMNTVSFRIPNGSTRKILLLSPFKHRESEAKRG